MVQYLIHFIRKPVYVKAITQHFVKGANSQEISFYTYKHLLEQKIRSKLICNLEGVWYNEVSLFQKAQSFKYM